MSLDGTTNTFIPYTINGINPVAGSINTTNFVKYSGNTSNTDLDGFDLTTAGTLSAQQFAIPDNNANDESWITYTVSTMGNPSTTGGLITTNTNGGSTMYFTGSVLGAPNFQFTTLGNAGKVVCTNGNSVMSTTINAGQLDYITALTSQAGGVGQNNTWTGSNNFTTLTDVAALRITSSVSNVDYSVSVNGMDFLEFTNLLTNQKVYTDGDSVWIPNRLFCNDTVYTNDIQMGNTIYFAYGTGQQWGTTLNSSAEYVIQDDVGDTRLKLSKSTGLTISTLNISAVPSATPTLALGVNGSGGVVSFAVPTPGVNLLPLDNTWTGTNTFNNTVSTLSTTTVSSKAFLTQSLRIAGMTTQAVQPGTITGGAPWLMTPNPTNSPFASCFSPTQTWITGARYIFRFTDFTYAVFGMSLTIFQANTTNTGANQISATFPFVPGDFTGQFTPNSNPGFVGQVYLQFQGTANKTFTWTSFTYEVGTLEVDGAIDMNGIATINGGSNFAVANNYMQTGSLTIGDNTRNYGGGGGWNTNTAGLLFECLDNTEIAVHDAGLRVASLMYYDGPNNTIFMGRDMGWATSNVAVKGNFTMDITKPLYLYYISGVNHAGVSCESSGDMVFFTGTSGVANQLRISNGGDVVATNNLKGACLVITSGGTYQEGCIYSDGNWGMLFRGRVPGAIAEFEFRNSVGTERMRIDPAGTGVFYNSWVVNGDFTKTGGNANANRCSLRGTDLNNSPYLEFFVANVRRSYIGFATTTSMNVFSENGANLQLGSEGITRMVIDTAGNTTFNSRELRVNQLNGNGQIRLTNGGGGYGFLLYNDAGNFYMLLTNNGDPNGAFNGLRPFYIEQSNGRVNMNNGLRLNGTGIQGVIQSAGMISQDAIQEVSFSFSTIYLYNNTGPNPLSYNPTTWASGGYTIITKAPGPTNPALGMGGGIHPDVPGGRSVIISLAPAVAWGELILSAQTIYTACNGVLNLYTNGGGWVFISDKRCKRDIKDIKTNRSLERIMALKPKTYKKIYPENPETPISQKVRDADHIGFLAQDVMECNPHCIDEWVDDNSVCDDDDGKRLGIAYGDINVHMVGAIQELKKQNDAQQKEIDELKELVRQLIASKA